MLAVLFRIKCLKKCSRSQIMLKKSASTIGKSLTGPTLMVLKGLGRMSWLYYDTCKLLDVLIFSKQDDKRLKKKWTVQCSVVKVLFKGGVSRIRGYQYVIFLIVVENPVLSVILRTMTPYVRSRFIKGLVKTFTKVSRTFPTYNLWYSSTNEINLKLKRKWQLEWNEHFKRSPKWDNK